MGNEESQPCSGKKLDNDIKVTWRKVRSCPYQPREGQSCAVSGRNLYVFGGVVGCMSTVDDTGQQTVCNQETNQLLKLDLEKNCWEEVSASGEIPEPRSGSTLAAVDNKLYLFGGLCGDRGWLNDFYIFNIGDGRWSKVYTEGEVPSPRDKLSSCTIGDCIYFFGGFGPDPLPFDSLDNIVEQDDDDDDEYDDIEIQDIEQEQQAAKFTWFGDIHRYDTRLKTWTCFSFKSSNDPWPSPRAAHSTSVIDNSFIIFGGRDSVGRQNDIWRFSPHTLKWTELHPLGCRPEARSFHTAVGVEKRMVVLGGRGITNQHFRDFHIYDSESNQWLQPSTEGNILPPSMGMHSLASVCDNIVLCFGTSDLDPITNSCTKYYADCFAIRAESVLSGKAISPKENGAVEKKSTEEPSAPPGFLNLQPSSTKSMNGV